MLNIVEDDVVGNPQAWGVSLDELARQGARRMLAEALEAEVEAYIEGHRQARDTAGKALVVRTLSHAQSPQAAAHSRSGRLASMTSG